MGKLSFVDAAADGVAKKHLSMLQRAKIPGKKFAGPNRTFPIEDKAHAKAAIADSRFAADPGKVKAAAEKVLRK